LLAIHFEIPLELWIVANFPRLCTFESLVSLFTCCEEETACFGGQRVSISVSAPGLSNVAR